ncbi:uncharacterized protein LTR77_000198 [Saxophila tyrrhenica]|uniref:Rhodopsin domain-containing protein n=1 Tax=Saxophila tyrrhenica TaxID=1690608 RepID=A0AAV9PM37_9PEZI|nr:hypothetical protein LTR77_000198 [Saxophila tyrrhenica]
MGLSGHASGTAVVGVTIGMTVLAGLAVFARLFARIFIVHNAGVDDGFITAALLFSIATTVTMCLQVKWGMGQHINTLTLYEAIQSQKPFYISVWVYNLSMSCTKFSILLQYLRIFPQVVFRRSCYVMMGVVAVYACWTFFSAVFACWPISYFWTQVKDPTGGQCLNRFAVWFANAGMNIATDIAVGLLPMRVLRELDLPKGHKIALMIVFGLGGFTCVVSILRLESLYVISKAKDVTWENPLAAIWSSVECNTGILCSCLPTLRSCVSRLFPKLLGTFRSNNSDQKDEPSSDRSGSDKPSEPAPPHPLAHGSGGRGGRSKLSFDALGRGLTGRGDPLQSSYAYSGNDSSSEEHEMDIVPLPAGDERQIQVTTVVAQDIERITDDEGVRTGRGPRTVRAFSQGSHG